MACKYEMINNKHSTIIQSSWCGCGVQLSNIWESCFAWISVGLTTLNTWWLSQITYSNFLCHTFWGSSCNWSQIHDLQVAITSTSDIASYSYIHACCRTFILLQTSPHWILLQWHTAQWRCVSDWSCLDNSWSKFLDACLQEIIEPSFHHIEVTWVYIHVYDVCMIL